MDVDQLNVKDEVRTKSLTSAMEYMRKDLGFEVGKCSELLSYHMMQISREGIYSDYVECLDVGVDLTPRRYKDSILHGMNWDHRPPTKRIRRPYPYGRDECHAQRQTNDVTLEWYVEREQEYNRDFELDCDITDTERFDVFGEEPPELKTTNAVLKLIRTNLNKVLKKLFDEMVILAQDLSNKSEQLISIAVCSMT